MTIGILNYAPRPRGLFGRRFRRWTLLTLLLAAAACAWWWRQPIWTHVNLAFWYQRCASYSPAPDQIVFDNDPAKIGQRQQKNGYVSYSQYEVGANNQIVAGYGYQPSCFIHLYATWPMKLWGAGPSGPPILFMHERTSHAGLKRLVIVAPMDGYRQCIQDIVLPSPKWTVPITGTYEWGPTQKDDWQTLEKSCERYYAGQIDPADASHFTIRYEMNVANQGWVRGTIDGFLKDNPSPNLGIDACYVVFQVRDGPAKEKPSP